MEDLNNPRISAYKAQRRLLLPKPPGYRSKLSGAQRKQKARARARADARARRLHLVGLTDAAMIIVGVTVIVVAVVVVAVLISRH